MTKLKLGPLADDKSVKLSVELRRPCIATWSLTPRFWATRAGSPRLSRRNSLLQWSSDSWRPIEGSPKGAGNRLEQSRLADYIEG